MNKAAIHNISDKIDSFLSKLEAYHQQQKRSDFAQWLTTSLSKGGGAAHRFASGMTKALPLPGSVYDNETKSWLFRPQEKAEYWTRMWDRVWGKRTSSVTQMYADIQRDAQM